MQHVRVLLDTCSSLRSSRIARLSSDLSLPSYPFHRYGAPPSPRIPPYKHEQRACLRTRPRHVKFKSPPLIRRPVIRSPFRKTTREDGAISLIRTPRREASSETLEKELAWTVKNTPRAADVRDILRLLIEERGIQPSTQHFEALILENCDPRHGSIENVQRILEDMRRESVPMNTAIHRAILKVRSACQTFLVTTHSSQVLAIHPNSDLRKQTYAEMEQTWSTLTTEDRHVFTVALIRESQLELAQEEIKKMRAESVHVEQWLYALLIHRLDEKRDYEGILKLAYELQDAKIEMPGVLWRTVLDHHKSHTERRSHLFKWIWNKYVETLHIQAPYRASVEVLFTFISRGEVEFAERIIDILNATYPDKAEQTNRLVDRVYDKAGQTRDTSKLAPLTMPEAFSELNGHDKAYFDPRIAMRKRPMKRYMNPRREQHRLRYKKLLRTTLKRFHYAATPALESWMPSMRTASLR